MLRLVPGCHRRSQGQVGQEHGKHSAGCAFLALQKDVSELTLQDFLKLDKERMKNMIVSTPQTRQKKISEKVAEIEEAAKCVRREIEHHIH
ncbi:PREDICTED: baculoviral IAP repeat-containing protein 5-like [Tinamus guttatus]|uniref:baculoviral IAP repeat-containing protein 5-like n=1 Tax=Tinamus guttatus TaxID=94827 RepID=UPI00052EAF26|nr:PREDICTED: baculoviral IAP repeat-containing protein 5-like [Tinamus guttatus]